MPSFSLAPVSEADFEVGQPFTHRFSVRTSRSADEVFAEIHADRPLAWCKGLKRITWKSERPFGVGTKREVVTAMGLVAQERYIVWDDATRVTAFTFESANLPLFKRFGERYTVTPTAGGGSEFLWEFVAEPKGPALVQKLVFAIARKVDLAAIERDTRRHFPEA